MLQSFTFNPFQENTYVLYSEEGEAIVIDPGCHTPQEEQILEQFLRDRKLRPLMVLLTHAHLDHVLGNHWVHQRYGLAPNLHPLDLPDLNRMEAYAPLFGVEAKASPPPASLLHGGETLTWTGPDIPAMQAPGHSPGSLCYYIHEANLVVSGDVLFRESTGRTDLPGGDLKTLVNSM